MLTWLFLTAGWAIFGILAYGMAKGTRKTYCQYFRERYTLWNELMCWLGFVSGPIGLFIANEQRARVIFPEAKIFCFRMPKEFRKGR